jgi:hypothetical protein
MTTRSQALAVFLARTVSCLAAAALVAAASGCGRNDIQVYRVAKETGSTQAHTHEGGADSSDAGSAAMPGLTWKLPEGWKEVPPGQMRVASFQVENKGGSPGDVSIVPLPGMAGNDLDNVNRWRNQVGASPITELEMEKSAQPVEIAGQTAKLFDEAGPGGEGAAKNRVLAAVLRRDGVAWFFKLTGEDSLVGKQKSAFVDFLKSVQFTAPAMSATAGTGAGTPQLPPNHPPLGGMPSAASAAPGATSAPKTGWAVPSTWKEVDAGQFLFAKYVVAGEGTAQAAVNVSTSVGDGGGTLANVNRWRGQLGLAPFGEADLSQHLQTLDAAGGKAMVVDMSGTDPRTQQKTRLIAAIVPQSGKTWFFKLMGNDQLVERESLAFTKFVQTVKIPDGQ